MTVGQVLPLAHTNMMAGRKPDLYSFRPAFCYLLASLKQLYPVARIYNITNSELSEEVTDSMDEICRHYGIENIRLHDIDKQWGASFCARNAEYRCSGLGVCLPDIGGFCFFACQELRTVSYPDIGRHIYKLINVLLL